MAEDDRSYEMMYNDHGSGHGLDDPFVEIPRLYRAKPRVSSRNADLNRT
jgi:hypothetical protein